MSSLAFLVIALGCFAFASASGSCGGSNQMLTVEDYEEAALTRLPKSLADYLKRGSGKDSSMNRNYEYLSKIRVIPRYLRDLSNLTSETTILDKSFDMPIGLAPSSLQKRWHPLGEIASVKAAASRNTIMIASTANSVSLEDIAKEEPDAELWFQLFLINDKKIHFDLLRRAEAAGYDAIVITIDMPVSALRYHNVRNQHKDIYPYVNTERYKERGNFSLNRDEVTWDDLAQVISNTSLPVIVKGIMSPEDAKLARENGARGIIVSNHGGRQIDGTISSIEALAEVVDAIPDARRTNFDIYYDGGIMSGLDVYRALALGAKFVFVGRAPTYGLVHSGQEGVENVLDILDDEFRTTMAQAGFKNVESITRDSIDVKF